MIKIKLKPGDIARRVKDGKLCYICNTTETGIFRDSVAYDVVDETRNSQHTDFTTNVIFEFIARKFIPSDVHAYDKIFIWKSGRWIAEFVASCDDKYVWTIGHGRVLFKDVVPYSDVTKNLFRSTDRQAAIKFHQYDRSKEFIEHIDDIKKEFT